MPPPRRKTVRKKSSTAQDVPAYSDDSHNQVEKMIVAKKVIPPRLHRDNGKTEDSETEKKPRAPRKKVTIDSHFAKYEKILTILDIEIERKQKEREKGIRTFRSLRKMIKELHDEVPKIANIKRRTSSSGKKVSGFVLECKITNELADFMKLPPGSTPSRSEITNAICMYSRAKENENRPQMLKWKHLNPEGKRDLQDPNNRMVIIPDKKLSDLLRYEKYKRDVKLGKITHKVKDKQTRKEEVVKVTDSSLRYWVIQRLIKGQIIETLKVKNVEVTT